MLTGDDKGVTETGGQERDSTECWRAAVPLLQLLVLCPHPPCQVRVINCQGCGGLENLRSFEFRMAETCRRQTPSSK